MKRNKKIVLMSHCILNQNTVVEPLARSKGPYCDIVRTILDLELGIHQMPCPEYRHLGLSRKPMTKEEYDTEDFRKLCRSISDDMMAIIREYLDSGYKIVALIGINRSPSCSIRGSQGILMEELLASFEEEEIEIPLIDVPSDYYDGEAGEKFIEDLRSFLEEGLSD